IVDKKSATLNLPGSRERQVAVHADHSTICKFGDAKDCESVIEIIAFDMEKALNLYSYCSPTSTTNKHWNLPRSVNPLFRGRDGIIKRIKEALTPKKHIQKQRCFVLTGIGGQGKSEVCLKVADEMREMFWGIFWVDVGSDSMAAEGFIKISKMLGSAAETIDDVRQLLSSRADDWLLILDNADDRKFDYSCYFPPGKRGAILLTSRNPDCAQLSTVDSESLEHLEQADCISLFLQAARIKPPINHEEDVLRIITLLNSHTLALIQAGRYIAKYSCPIKEYPNEYERQSKRLLSFSSSQLQSRYQSVYATFEASAQALETSNEQEGSDSLDILHILAIMHYSSISLQLFEDAWNGAQAVKTAPEEEDNSIDKLTRWHVSQLPQLIQGDKNIWDPNRIRDAIVTLESLALIQVERNCSFQTVSLHPLVCAWAYERQNTDQCFQSWISTGCILALSRYKNIEWKPYQLSLRLHIQSLLNKDKEESYILSPSMWKFQIYFQCCQLMNDLRMDAICNILLKKLFYELNLSSGEPMGEFLKLYKLASDNLYKMGEVKKAIQTWQKILQIEKTTLAGDHPDRLASQYALAGAYQANGQTKDAIQLLEHIVKVWGTTLAEDHPNRLASQHALAGVYEANGQTKDAIQLLEHVVKVQETTLAEDHPSRLASQHELAGAYQANGQTKD
ncbi:hypothetical protein FQN57_003785, partial [Myotisia sp. PD_48]